MFDVSLGELGLIGAVALIVLGPEKLQRVARTAGLLIGRAQRFVASVKGDLQREVDRAEISRIENELRQQVYEISAPYPDTPPTTPLAADPAPAAATEPVAAPEAGVVHVPPPARNDRR